MGDLSTVERTEPVAQRHAGGRPTLYTTEIGEQLCEYLREGDSIVAACGMCAVDMQRFYEWKRQHEQFRDMVARARAEGERRYSRAMLRGAEGDPEYKGDWKAAESVLKRQYLASGWGDTIDVRKLDTAQLIEMFQNVTQSQPEAIPEADLQIEAGLDAL